MQQEAESLVMEAAREGGKPLVDSRIEMVRAIDSIRLCVECLRGNAGEAIPMGLNASSAGKQAWTMKEPIGVVVAISAFNHPLNLIAHQIGPAIAAGCPVIVKPAEATPLSCFRLVAMLRQAGLPDGWCQALLTENLDVAGQLVSDPRVAFLSFIGNARVGWMLRSRLAPGTRCALELATAKLLKGGFYHAGQVCVSAQRIFAERSIARELAARLAAACAELRVGDPTREDTDIGPLIRPQEVNRVESRVQEAVDSGAECLCGGHRLSETSYACTVLFEPADEVRVSHEEIFGPVVCIYPFDDPDAAIRRANALPWAFQAAIFGNDMRTIMPLAQALDASAVMINEHTAFRVDWMPFAGLRHSGLGVGGIPYTFNDMQVDKLMVISGG